MNQVHEVLYFSSVHMYILFDCAIYADVYTVIKKQQRTFTFIKVFYIKCLQVPLYFFKITY